MMIRISQLGGTIDDAAQVLVEVAKVAAIASPGAVVEVRSVFNDFDLVARSGWAGRRSGVSGSDDTVETVVSRWNAVKDNAPSSLNTYKEVTP